MRTLFCQYCGKEMQSVRSDKKRCRDCRTLYNKEFAQSERGRKLRVAAHLRVRQAAFEGYGNACQCCGEDIHEFLALDHVNGGGREERKTMSTYQIARKVINENWPDTYQVLCHNCNQAKGWYGSCPHQREAD